MTRTGIAIGIITALDRELHSLIDAGGWTGTRLESGGRSFICHEEDDEGGGLVAVAGGIGSKQAEAAARAVVDKYQPRMLISAGLAGALTPGLKVASIVTPDIVVDAVTGTQYGCTTPQEQSSPAENLGHSTTNTKVVLVTASEIAGAQSKANLAERFHAQVVDMEAAGVAGVALECKKRFRCVKAISDEFDFPMPPLNRFVDGDGNFRTGSFAAWAVVRPQHWLGILRLSRNSARALRALSAWLDGNLGGGLDSGAVVTLDGAEFQKH